MITLRDDWYDANDGRYCIIIGVKGGAPHKLRFWSYAAAGAYVERMLKQARKKC